jgi:hypothetical protein
MLSATGALYDADWSVRAAATQIVAQTADVELQESLLPLFQDKNQKSVCAPPVRTSISHLPRTGN